MFGGAAGAPSYATDPNDRESPLNALSDEQREVVLRPLTLLDSVVTIALAPDLRMREFLEHKQLGLGFFLDRAELQKNDHRLLKDVMVGAPAFHQVNQRYAVSNRYMNVPRQQRECPQLAQGGLARLPPSQRPTRCRSPSVR